MNVEKPLQYDVYLKKSNIVKFRWDVASVINTEFWETFDMKIIANTLHPRSTKMSNFAKM